jgi:hypothetical protein
LFAATFSKQSNASAISVFCTYFTSKIWAEIYLQQWCRCWYWVVEQENFQYYYVVCFAWL